jgi:hypothetical protein
MNRFAALIPGLIGAGLLASTLGGRFDLTSEAFRVAVGAVLVAFSAFLVAQRPEKDDGPPPMDSDEFDAAF